MLFPCTHLAIEYKKLLNINENFDTRLRVERRSTNFRNQATAFKALVPVFAKSNGESFGPRKEKPSSPDFELVTATIYPFAREVQGAMGARVRIREYGERKKGSLDPWTSTSGDFVSLEIKAKTDQPGVVIKPILKLPKSMVKKMFSTPKDYADQRNSFESELIEVGNDPALVKQVLDDIGSFYTTSDNLKLELSATAILYTRDAYVLKVAPVDQDPMGIRDVQITFDTGIGYYDSIPWGDTPFEVTQSRPPVLYPTSGDQTLVVTEMKSDLQIDKLYRDNADELAKKYPTYVKTRKEYEKLQANQAFGFEPDSGKGAQSQELNK